MKAGTLRQAGRSQAEISTFAALQTRLVNAIHGFVGTALTGLLASLLMAIFLRKKK